MNSDIPSLGNLTTFGIPCLCTMHYMIKHGLIMCKNCYRGNSNNTHERKLETQETQILKSFVNKLSQCETVGQTLQ